MEWYYVLALVIIFLSVDSIFGLVLYGKLEDEWVVFIPMPEDFKDNTEMNWFGCIVCYIFLFLIFPIINICKFIYWLFHI